MAVVTLTKDNFATEVEQAQGPVLVDFWATWCGPCRMIGPVVEQIAEANAGKLKVGKVNVDEQPELAARFGVMSIPTLILFKGCQQVEQVIGANPGALGAMVQNNI